VNVVLSDMPFSWDGMTAERYEAFRARLGERDSVIATQIEEHFRALLASESQRAKALVIMNYRHAFAPISFVDGGRGDNVGRYLFERFDGRVANVLLNTVRPTPTVDDRGGPHSLVHAGKWDAAFQVAGNPNVGLDFGGSPFGADAFDLFPFREHRARYRDVFTGFVFYAPLAKHRQGSGIPGLLPDNFVPTFLERAAISGWKIDPAERDSVVLRLQQIRLLTYDESAEWPDGTPAQQIERWLGPQTP